jgi:hypothetical protein
MAEIINLNRHRKSRERDTKETRAKMNRALHGIPAIERAVARAEERRAQDKLAGKRTDDDPPPRGPGPSGPPRRRAG